MQCELGDVKSSTTSFASDLFPLGYIFKFIANGFEFFLDALRSQML